MVLHKKAYTHFSRLDQAVSLSFYDVDVYSVGKTKHQIVDITLDQDGYGLNTLADLDSLQQALLLWR